VIYEVLHRTSYDYAAPVVASFAELHQLPDDVDGQRCISRTLTFQPLPEHRHDRRDWFGNLATVIAIREPHLRFEVTSSCVVDTSGRPDGFGDHGRRAWSAYTVTGTQHLELEVIELTLDSPLVTRGHDLRAYASASFGPGVTLADAVTDLCHRIHGEFAFDPGATDVDTPLDEVLARRRGVCQDFAHVMIGALRSLGLAAGYVSGYLETEPPPGEQRLTGVDRTHAWVSVHVGDGRWVGVDPTNDRIAGPRYISTARGRDYSDVPPLKGVIVTESATSTLHVSVDVIPR
jgi:transglutaminase-like putative cysteine protease